MGAIWINNFVWARSLLAVIELSFPHRLARFSFRPGFELDALSSLGIHFGMLRK
jgi:hypothetical protein